MAPSSPGIFATDDWTLAEGQRSGKPFIVRMRSTLPSEPDRAIFCNLIIIRWNYQANENGMPESSDFQRMGAFEDAIEAGTEKRRHAYQAVAITGGAEKQWRYFASSVDMFMQSLNEDLAGHEPYPLQIEMFQDPDWMALREWQDRASPKT